MTFVAIGSARGAPGVTTAAVAVAASWPAPGGALVVEADADGGVLAARFGLAPDPGLVSLAAACRRHPAGALLADHGQELPGGLPVIVAPPGPEQASAAVAAVRAAAAGWRAPGGSGGVVADCGRLAPRSPALDVAAGADVVLVACRPRVDEAAALAQHVPSLLALGPPVCLLAVGRHPHDPEDLARAVGLDLVGVIEDDPVAATLAGGRHGSTRTLHRSPLLRSARTVAEAVLHLVEGTRQEVTL